MKKIIFASVISIISVGLACTAVAALSDTASNPPQQKLVVTPAVNKAADNSLNADKNTAAALNKSNQADKNQQPNAGSASVNSDKHVSNEQGPALNVLTQ